MSALSPFWSMPWMIVSSLICLLGIAGAEGIPEKSYKYQEEVGDKVIPFSWEIKESEGQVLVTVYEKDKSFFNVCSDDGVTTKWRFYHRAKHDIVVRRQGNQLYVTGTKEGDSYKKTFEIDGRPWFQSLSYSLGNFLRSEEKTIQFWTVRADSLEPIVLKASKKAEEPFVFKGSTIAAQKIEVRASGFYSPFWHGSYWFRKSDQLFLMYRSVHGLPGTEETVVTLLGPYP